MTHALKDGDWIVRPKYAVLTAGVAAESLATKVARRAVPATGGVKGEHCSLLAMHSTLSIFLPQHDTANLEGTAGGPQTTSKRGAAQKTRISGQQNVDACMLAQSYI